MKLFCTIIGRECLEENCAQWDKWKGCLFYSKIGHFLYYSSSMMDWTAFIKYLEEIRPKEGKNEALRSGSFQQGNRVLPTSSKLEQGEDRGTQGQEKI